MKSKITTVLFCGFLSVMCLFLVLVPGKSFSEKEKRYLEEPPRLTVKSLLSGEFGEKAENYAADHLPMRDLLIGLSADLDRLMLRQTTKEIYIGADDRLFERPAVCDPEDIAEKLEVINAFASETGRSIGFGLVPSAGYMLENSIGGLADSYADGEIISLAYSLAGEGVYPIDIVSAFETQPDPGALYYRTDHHWTSLGAFTAANVLLERFGKTPLNAELFTVESVPGFYGTTYSRSALWRFSGEELELWHAEGDFTVTNSDDDLPHKGLFYTEYLSDADKYPVFLGGNHPIIRIENSDPCAEGSILLIRDSYSSSIAPFLAQAYKTVVLADLRYYKYPLSQLLEDESFDSVIVLYSVGNFTSDTNLLLLE